MIEENYNTVQPLKSLYSEISNRDQHDIRDFLSRPIRIYSGTWNVADTPGTTLVFSDLLETLSVGDVYEPVRSKLKGFLGFRGIARIRVQVNAQPFQTGSLIMGYYPLYKKMPNHYQRIVSYGGLGGLSYMSAGPHAILDIAQNTDFVLDCPYVAPHTWYNMSLGDLTWGTVVIKVLAQLRSIATGGLPYTVYLSFHDVEFYGSTAIPASFQGPVDSGSQTEITGISGVRARGASQGYRIERPPPTTESSTQTPPDPSAERKTQQREGVISGFARATGNIARVISAAAPPLAWVAKPVSWIADVVEWGAKKFGFCKPNNLAPVNGFKQQPTKYNLNGDGESHSHPLGLLSNNELATVNFAGSDIDEMHFGAILKRPCIRGGFNWGTDQEVGTVLFSSVVSPIAGVNFVNTINHDEWQPILMSYLALAFKQWTGSINYRFQFFLNQFYSGRLRFVFIPGDVDHTPMPNELVSSFNSFAIVDIRSKSTFEMNVPYVATVPFKLVEPVGEHTLITKKHKNASSTGRIYVVVEEQLRAPDTVSSQITCYVHQWAGDDFQLAVPKQPDYVPVIDIDTVSPETFYEEHEEIAHLQGLSDTMPALVAQPSTITSQPHGPLKLSKAATCVGEHVDTLRVLMKRFLPMAYLGSSAAPAPPSGYRKIRSLFPHFLTWKSSTVDTTDTNGNGSFIDYISYFSQMYAFRRGGVRIQMQELSTTDKIGVSWNEPTVYGYPSNLFTTYYNTPDIFELVKDNGTSEASDFSSANAVQPIIQSLEGLYDLEVPYYSNVPFVINARITASNAINNSNPAETTTMFDSHYIPYGKIFTNNTNSANALVYRAASEDFSFGFLHGPPTIRRVRNDWEAFTPPTASSAEN